VKRPAAQNGNHGDTAAVSGRGRPRDEEFDRRILAAGFEELSRSGISHFSVAAVARRANVSKGSIYLRWPAREQLIHDSAVLVAIGITRPAGASLREKLEQLADQWAEAFRRPGAIGVLLRVDADRDDHPDLFERIYEHTQEAGNRVITQVLREARASGEISADVSPTLLNRMFVGALFVQALSRTPAGDVSLEFRRSLVDFLIAALGCGQVPGAVTQAKA
jgi:AcrR family transcriptional regulator